MNEQDANRLQAEFLASIDRAGAVPLDAHFPQETSPEFRAAAAEVIRQLARVRFLADGGDLAGLEALDDLDTTTVLDARDLAQAIEGFHANGDMTRYSICRAVLEWAEAAGKQN